MLRPYQGEALDAVAFELSTGLYRLLIQLPTGTGKTVVFANLYKRLNLTGRMLVLAHREELVEQAADKIRKWNPGIRVGIEMAQRECANTDQIVVASVQTLHAMEQRRLAQFLDGRLKAVVCDEAHHSTATTYVDLFTKIGLFDNDNRILLVGVTATPNRPDGTGLGEVYQKIVYEMSMLRAIEEGWLVDLKGFRIRTQVVLDGIKTRAGDFAQDELEKTVNTTARNELIVQEWLKRASIRQTIAFTVDIQHAKDLAETFQRYGVAAQAVWGNDPHRREKLAAHRARQLQVLCNAQVLTEGYDDWGVSCIVLAAPTKSGLKYVQMVGRGTRIPDGINNLLEAKAAGQLIAKTDCIILDVVDVSKKNSLVTLPTLFGLQGELDLKGRSVVGAFNDMKKAAKEHPEVDLSRLDDISKLNSFVEEVDLFKVNYPPEVLEASENKWHRAFDGSYVLMLTNGDDIVVGQNALGAWEVVGEIRGNRFRDNCRTREEAMRRADEMVVIFGGPKLKYIVKRTAKTDSNKPSAQLLALAKRLRLNVPPGATNGEVRAAVDKFMAAAKARRQQRGSRP